MDKFFRGKTEPGSGFSFFNISRATLRLRFTFFPMKPPISPIIQRHKTTVQALGNPETKLFSKKILLFFRYLNPILNFLQKKVKKALDVKFAIRYCLHIAANNAT
jgi:hypothetical protein